MLYYARTAFAVPWRRLSAMIGILQWMRQIHAIFSVFGYLLSPYLPV